MSPQSRLVAGIVLIIVPTVEIGGASILSVLIGDPGYAQNDLRQDLWRANVDQGRGVAHTASHPSARNTLKWRAVKGKENGLTKAIPQC
jgi:hypothetical protein